MFTRTLFITAALSALFTLTACSSLETRELKDKNGKVYAKKHYEKGENDKEIPRKVEYDKERNGSFERTILFNEQGKLKEVAVDKDTDQKKERSVYYDTESKEIKRKSVVTYRKDGETPKRTVTFYPGTKNVREITRHDKEGKVVRTIRYDESGKLTSIEPRKANKGSKK